MPPAASGRRRVVLALLAVGATVAAVRIALPAGEGLRGQYFRDPRLAGAAAERVVDGRISTAQIFRRWHASPPAAFGAQWSGFIHIEHAGRHTFWITSDDGARLYIDGRLVVQNDGLHLATTQSGDIQLDEGPHAILLQYSQEGGAYVLEWSWARDGGAPTSIPRRVLTTTPRYGIVVLAGFLDWALWALAGAGMCVAILPWSWSRARRASIRVMPVAAGCALSVVLAVFYVAAATGHARIVNLSKARGDQTGYLADAQHVYANWLGRTPQTLIGERNRMPLYAGYLALFYDPKLSDDEYFVVAKTWNIRLSLALVALLAVVFIRYLPALLAANLTLIVAFGIFVFKAGYAQSELLFYALFFATFVLLLDLLEERAVRAQALLAALAGVVGGLSYLTKAAAGPLVAIFVIVFVGRALVARRQSNGDAGARPLPLVRQLIVPVLVVATFLAVLAPYLLHNKQTFGRYFYNVNTTFYIWYDTWPEASVGTILHGDGAGWPSMPEADIPSMAKYWRTHSVGQIVGRIGRGFEDMVVRSFNTYWYFKYVVLYAGIALAVFATNRRQALAVLRSNWESGVFVLLYLTTYLIATAFYEPISGTGTTRFLLAHVTPLLFVASRFFAETRIARTGWRLGGSTIELGHVHLFVAAMIAFDIVFVVWPRLMTTYGGF